MPLINTFWGEYLKHFSVISVQGRLSLNAKLEAIPQVTAGGSSSFSPLWRRCYRAYICESLLLSIHFANGR